MSDTGKLSSEDVALRRAYVVVSSAVVVGQAGPRVALGRNAGREVPARYTWDRNVHELLSRLDGRRS